MNDLEAVAAADVGFVVSAGDAAAAAAISASHASVKGTLNLSVIKALLMLLPDTCSGYTFCRHQLSLLGRYIPVHNGCNSY